MARQINVTVGKRQGGPAAPRFPGDPGVGKYYLGGREDQKSWPDSNTAFANWEANMNTWSGGKTLNIHRQYGNGDITTGFTVGDAGMRNNIAHHRMNHVSFHLPTGVTQAGAVAKDVSFVNWMDGLANRFKSYAPNPIWWTFNHEPEGDAQFNTASGQVDYRAIQRNIFQAMKSRGVTNTFNWCCGYMAPFTFGDKSSPRDWRQYYPDWKGTTTPFANGTASSKNNPNPVDFYAIGSANSCVEGVGLDVYSWWDEGEALSIWTSFPALMKWVTDRMGFLNPTYCIMEHGVQAYHTGTWNADPAVSTAVFGTTNNNMTLDYISGAFDYMAANDVVALQVFNYALTQPLWRLELGDTPGVRYHGYGLGMARPAFADPPY